VFGIDQIGVRMMPAEVRQRRAIENRIRRRTKSIDEDSRGIRPGDRGHRIETKTEAGSKQAPDLVEIEQLLHEHRVVMNRINDLDFTLREANSAKRVEIDIRRRHDLISGDGFRTGKHGLGQFFRRRTAISYIVFDTEVPSGRPDYDSR